MVSMLASVWAGFERAADVFCAPARGMPMAEALHDAHDAMADVDATFGLLAGAAAVVPEMLESLNARDAFRAENDAFGWWYRVGFPGDLVWQTKKRRGEPVNAFKDWREIDFAARKAAETGEFLGAVEVRDAIKARGVRGNVNIKDLI